jgi:hypothetical protein
MLLVGGADDRPAESTVPIQGGKVRYSAPVRADPAPKRGRRVFEDYYVFMTKMRQYCPPGAWSSGASTSSECEEMNA